MSKFKVFVVMAVLAIMCIGFSYAAVTNTSKVSYDTTGEKLVGTLEPNKVTYHTFSTRPSEGKSGVVIEVFGNSSTTPYTTYTFPFFVQVPDFKYTQSANTYRKFILRPNSENQHITGTVIWTYTQY